MSKEIKKKMTIGKSKKILRGFLEKDCYIDTPLYYAIPYILDYLQQKENIIKGLDNTIENLEEVVEHKDNIIKEVRDFAKGIVDSGEDFDGFGWKLLEILDKGE